MFHNTRLKLTAWYLLIIMLISIAFSVVLFKELFGQVAWFTQEQEARFQRRFQIDFGNDPVMYVQALQNVRSMNSNLMTEARNRLMILMFMINGGIFLLAGVLGYVLAGKTLRPIQDMVDEQNQFISDASHELRTPLTALKSSMEVFLRGKRQTVPEAKEVVADGIEEVNKLQSLSESLLQIAQYQKPNGNLKFERLSVDSIIDEALHRVKPLGQIKGMQFKYLNSLLKVYGNKYSLVDLFVILLDNAIKYSGKGSSVEISSGASDGAVEIAITDHGIGISEEDVIHVFDRFYRADEARSKNNTSGYGLGLSIAKGIVQAHKGTIKVESKLHEGSTFTIRIPASKQTT